MGKWKATIVTHTDLDGVGAAAVYIRLAGLVLGGDTRLFFTEPYTIDKLLQGLDTNTEKVVVSDIGVNAPTLDSITASLQRLAARGVQVEWYDHHRWQREWIEKLSSTGARIHVDTSTCATGVVAKYAPLELGVEPDDYIEELARIVCAADLWKWDHYMAPKLYRVASRYRGAKGDEWRRKMITGLAQGSLWWPDLEEALQEYITAEFKGFAKALPTLQVDEINGCRIGYVLKDPGPPAAGILAATVMARKNLDVAVIVRRKGSGISLRSQGRINVQKIALAGGGGGHPSAAGMPLKIPWYARLAARIYPPIRLRYARKTVREAIARLGGCPLQERD